MNRLKQSINPRQLYKKACILLFIVLYFLSMHGLRKSMMSSNAYSFIEITRLLCCLILLPALLWGLCKAFEKSWRMERIFLLLFIPLSLLMMGVMPISRVPDELAHLERIYLVSEGHLFPSSEPVSYPQNLLGWGEDLRLSQMMEEKDVVFSNEQITVSGNMATGIYPVNSYFPQALGMAIAKLFTINKLTVFYAARLGAWLVTLLLLYRAIRLAPGESKIVLLMISLFPMTLQEAISASADGMTIGFVACLSAFVLHARKEKHLFRSWDILEGALLAIGVVTFKVMYFPFLFMFLLVPQECFGEKNKRNTIITAWIVGALALILLWAWMCKTRLLDSGASSLGGNIFPQLMYVIQHPFRFFLTLLHTISLDFSNYLSSLFGFNLSWYNLPMPSLLLCMIVLFFFLAWKNTWGQKALHEEKAVWTVTLVLTVSTMLIIFLFLYVWWSGYRSELIIGVQGRYFIPILFPILAAAQYTHDCSNETLTQRQCDLLKWFAVMDMFVLMSVLLYTI